MTDFSAVETIPLARDADGVIRVSGTRVTLDTIIEAFYQGATAEEIAQQYPSVPLADIYQVIGYYLHHSAELDAYLREQRELAKAVRHENERRYGHGLRERLMARKRST